MLARRSVLASAIALPACAPVARVPLTAGRAACPAPVRADMGRVIRTVAGLRPYRPAGFVVRADPIGDRRIVHNYGHGGGGITLSWGTSRLAIDIGLPGHHGAVAVIGAGAVGLANARLVQEAGFAVTLYAKALPPETTSNIAGGQILPTSVYEDGMVTPAWMAQYRAATDYSWRRFQIMVGDDYGIHWVPTWHPARRRRADHPDAFLAAYQPAMTRIEAGSHSFGDRAMERFDTMYVETGRYLRRMLADFQQAGGRIVVRDVADPGAIAALPERLVFNCTGLGSHKLFGDTGLTPARGQLAVLLPQPEVDYAYFGGPWGYMFPRADGIVLGGTFEIGEWDATPRPQDIADIVAGHARLAAGWTCPT